MKPLSERPEVAPPDRSAVQRAHGRLPRVAFPLLVKLSKQRRDRKFTSCGNRQWPLAQTMLVERPRLVDWVEKQCACRHCGKRLRLSKLTSHQVGVCARVHFVCEKGCVRLKALETSTTMHGDDYQLNTQLNYAITTCALSFRRVVPALELLGLRAVSTTDHFNFKVTPRSYTCPSPPTSHQTAPLPALSVQAEIEPILADHAERSMAAAHEDNCVRGDTDFISFDGGYTAPRNAHGCTGAAHGPNGKIVDVEHKRLTDEGATSSQSLEGLCYGGLLRKPRVAVYGTVVFDGCRELIGMTHAAGKRAQGDLWHVGKNWVKWAEPAIKLLCKRPGKTDADKVELTVVPAVVVAPERLEPMGERPSGVKATEWVAKRVRELGGTPEPEATAGALKAHFGRLARSQAMTGAERAQELRREAYLAERDRRKLATKERGQQRAGMAEAEVWAMAWRRDLRSMLRYVGKYTHGLRGEDNPATSEPWTDAARAAEFKRLFRGTLR